MRDLEADLDHVAGVATAVDIPDLNRAPVGLRAGTATIAGIGAATEVNVIASRAKAVAATGSTRIIE